MSDYHRAISLRLCDIMENVGASDEMRRLHQTNGITSEIMGTMGNHLSVDYKLMSRHVFIFGSFAEGTTTPGLHSDIDILSYNDDRPVIENIRDAPIYGPSLLMVRDVHTQPGYGKLQLVANGIPQTVYNMNIVNVCDSDRRGRLCLKHLSGYGHAGFNERNGPADTNTDPPISYDHVAAYRCSTIPECANEWIRRPRPHGWPPRRLIDEMSTSGCFVVGVGHPTSDERHIEWRLSFSLQERQLMFSLNSVQHKCYIFLKMIKKYIIESVVGKSISSYHCKTCLFYVIEKTSAEIWRPKHLFQCVRLCLIVLLQWVCDGDCPNYFIKEENMFDRDVHIRIKQRLIDVLRTLISDGPTLLLRIECDQIRDILMGGGNYDLLVNANWIHTNSLNNFSVVQQWPFRRDVIQLLMKNECIDNCAFVLKLKLALEYCERLPDYDEQQTRETLYHITPFLHALVAQQLVSMAFSLRGIPHIRQLLHASDFLFRQGSTCDMTSSRLVYASVLYRLGQYDTCLRLIERIDTELNPRVLSCCYCQIMTKELEPGVYNFSSLSATASSVIFLPSDKAIAPPPLHYEMYRSVDTPPGSRNEELDYWYDSAVVDGKVYLYFFKYIVFSKLNKNVQKQVAIDNLQRVIQNDPNLGHLETGYNLLGWLYVQENRFQDGFQFFMESWRIKPLHNAAKWHLWNLVTRLMRQRH